MIGGYSALVWMLINFFFDGYENFKFTNSLIKKVYTSTPDGPDQDETSDKDASNKLLF